MTQPLDNNPEKIRDEVQAHIASSIFILYRCFTFIGLAIIASIFVIQGGSRGEILREKGDKYVYDTARIIATRGDILSSEGSILATSIPYYDLRMDFAAPSITDSIFESNVEGLASSLSEFFGDRSKDEYEKLLRDGRDRKHRYYSIAPRKVDYIELQRVKSFPMLGEPGYRNGFIAPKSYKRVMPFGDLASRTVGFVNTVGTKVGLEGAFDDVLCGIDGISVKQKISGDFWMPIVSPLNIDVVDGLDVQTTISVEMQQIAQSALWQRTQEVEADWGTVVIMETATGDIKAIANVRRDEKGQLYEEYNYAIGMSLEPGSTFKLPVLIDLLENSSLTLSSVFDTEDGRVQIGDALVVDTKRGGYGKLSLQGIFEHSSNIGMAKAVNKVYASSAASFVDRIVATGLGRELGLSVQGEPRPTVKHPRVKGSGWDGTSLTMMSYGYAIRLTPLQTLAYYNAVANGGKLMRPRFVTSLQRKGEVVREIPVEVLNEQIASPKTIKEAQRALRGVVENGTGQALKSPLYSVAAKTGTAQIAMGRSGYVTSDGSRYYLASLAGYFPADNPRYSMIVAFRVHHASGSSRGYYGGSLAAPLFKSIADEIYNSSSDFVESFSMASEEQGRRVREPNKVGVGGIDSLGVPGVVGLGFSRALEILEGRGFEVYTEGVGRVLEQSYLGDSVVSLRLGYDIND
ncbi:MAG: penicillin-binding protein 2 [Rikenellaceae bacterium]